MHRAMWTYPWDVLDLSAERVTAELLAAGLDTVSLATSYHAGRFLQVRSPVRKTFFPEDGTIYFNPTPARWDRLAIRPQVAAVVAEGGDVLADLVRRRDAGGLRVACWTVCLHNSRLGSRHPDAVTRNAYGEPSVFNLCPSHPDVRAYVTTLVADLSATYKPDRVELESPGFMGYAHDHHHEKDGLGLTAEDDLLLSLCFCPACLSRAAAAGVDGPRARATVRHWLDEAFGRAVPQPRWPDLLTEGIEAFRPHPEVYDYLAWRVEPVTSLVREIREHADPGTQIVVIDLQDGWLGGLDRRAAAEACDGVILCAYDMTPDAVSRLLVAGRATVGAAKLLGTGFRLFYPEMQGPEDISARVSAAKAAGCDIVNFYNYGLVPKARLDWISSAG